jgi:hypothetical protein
MRASPSARVRGAAPRWHRGETNRAYARHGVLVRRPVRHSDRREMIRKSSAFLIATNTPLHDRSRSGARLRSIRELAIVAVLATEAAEAEAVQAIGNATAITATCSRAIPTSTRTPTRVGPRPTPDPRLVEEFLR